MSGDLAHHWPWHFYWKIISFSQKKYLTQWKTSLSHNITVASRIKTVFHTFFRHFTTVTTTFHSASSLRITCRFQMSFMLVSHKQSYFNFPFKSSIYCFLIISARAWRLLSTNRLIFQYTTYFFKTSMLKN